ncbi:MAG: thiol reductase thioredoxin [Micrococcales bacterium]|nr:thiol reductase thioredoxin [Micrococcales bacterium]
MRDDSTSLEIIASRLPAESTDGVEQEQLKVDPTDLGLTLGPRATLLQFSSAFCQPCRSARLLLTSLAEDLPGVTFAELDAEDHIDLVRSLQIRRTPTILLLDSSGNIRKRAVGLPRKSEVVAALANVV